MTMIKGESTEGLAQGAGGGVSTKGLAQGAAGRRSRRHRRRRATALSLSFPSSVGYTSVRTVRKLRLVVHAHSVHCTASTI